MIPLAFAFAIAIVALPLIAGCTTTRWSRDTEMEANQPRALGLGSFAPSCLFFCSVTSEFTQTEQGGVDKDGLVRIESRGGVYTGPKRDAPPTPLAPALSPEKAK